MESLTQAQRATTAAAAAVSNRGVRQAASSVILSYEEWWTHNCQEPLRGSLVHGGPANFFLHTLSEPKPLGREAPSRAGRWGMREPRTWLRRSAAEACMWRVDESVRAAFWWASKAVEGALGPWAELGRAACSIRPFEKLARFARLKVFWNWSPKDSIAYAHGCKASC